MQENAKPEKSEGSPAETHDMDERARIVLDMSPFSAHIWDENFRIIDCNQAAVRLFNLSGKQEYIDRYFELTPEFQPDGSPSAEALKQHLVKTLEDGCRRVDWMRQSADGEQIPFEITLVRIDLKGRNSIAAYCRDMREHTKIIRELQEAQLTTSAMFGANPHINVLFDSRFNVIDCNPAAVSFMGFKSKEELLAGFVDRISQSIPRFQPDGRKSTSLVEKLELAVKHGHLKFESEIALGGVETILDVDLKKIPYKSDYAIVGFLYDMTEVYERENELIRIREENNLQLAKLNLIIEAAKIGLWDMEVSPGNPTSPDNPVVWSEQLRRLLGYADESDFPGVLSSLDNIIHPEDFKKVTSVRLAHLLDKTGKTPYIVEYRVRKKNGEYGYYRSTGETIRDKDGNPLRIAGSLMDISETKSMLFNNELQLAKINMAVKATKIALWEMEVGTDPVNPVNRVTWSDELRYQLGYQDENDFPNTVGSLQIILHPDDKEKTVEALVSHLSDRTGNTPYDAEYRAMKKNGEYGFYRGTGETVRDVYGNPIRVVGTQMDITEIKNDMLDKELQLIKMNLVLKATKIGLWDMEVNKSDPVNTSNYVNWSDEFRHFLGFNDENDFPNRISSINERLHPDDKDHVLPQLNAHLVDKTGNTPFDTEYRLLATNGEYRYFRATCETVRDKEGNPIHAAGALIDVTDTKNLIKEIDQQRMDAETANKAKSAFLSNMSHEIRTPMNAILGITEIQLQNEFLSADIRDAFDKIYNSGDLLLGIINDILDLSKIEAGKMELLCSQYEITSMISDTAQLNMMHIGSKSIEFKLLVDENTPVALVGDELRVKQIMNNLLSNAFKYTASGTVTMSLSAEDIPGNNDEVIMVFNITDTGQGMTQEQIKHLYTEYVRFNTAANRSTIGTGLGMSITQNLLRLMKGEIFVESEPGKGSSFTVRLPQGKTNSGVIGSEMASNLQRFRMHGKAQMRRVQITREPMPYGSVLIVDDVETNIYVAKGLMSPYKLKIDSADSGFAAIDKIKRGNSYDIIFMDHMIPKMDGIEATKIIREMGYNRPIVSLTANAVAGQSALFIGNGFDDYITKPIDIRELNVVLNKLIRDKQSPQVIEELRKQSVAEQPVNRLQHPVVNKHSVEIFLRDAKKTLSVLEALSENDGYSHEDNWKTYIINVHGIKTALANIGKMELSAKALKLEMAGRERKTGVIISDTPVFVDALKAYIDELNTHMDTLNEIEETAELNEDKSYLIKMLLNIKAACEEYNEYIADKSLEELRKKKWSQQTNELLSVIDEHLLHSDFEETTKVINYFVKVLLKQ